MDPQLTGWPALAMLACVLASYSLRRFTPTTGRWHTSAGAFALALLTAVLSATAQAIQAHGLALASIESAAIGAVLSLLATSNPSLLPPLKAIVVGIFIASASACAPTAAYVAALKVDAATSSALVDARTAWILFDKAHLHDIVMDATDKADGMAKLTAWHRIEDKVDQAFIDARDGIDVYHNALMTAGAAQSKDFSASATSMMQAVQALVQLLGDLGVKIQLHVSPALYQHDAPPRQPFALEVLYAAAR